MSHFSAAFRILILLISCYGYLRQLKKVVRIDFAFGILFSTIGCVMVLAGFLNVMREAAWLFLAVGILLACRGIWISNEEKLFHCPSVIYFAIMSGFLLFLLYQSKFVFYDNFTHWGVVSKALIHSGFFPNQSTINLTHPSYPLGSACFIYYFSEISGIASEWFQMWIQAVLITGMLVSLFSLCRNAFDFLLVAICNTALMCCNVNLVDLPVDTLLPAVSLAALVFCVYYRHDLENRMFFMIPYYIFLVSIKNSAVLFVPIMMVYCFFFIKNSCGGIRNWLIAAAAPAVVMYLWKKHVMQTFGTIISRHSISVANYQSVFENKTMTDNWNTIQNFFVKLTANIDGIAILTAAALVILAFRYFVQKRDIRELRILYCVGGISYLLFQIGLLGVYIFSMSASEALVTAQYPRYNQTILMFCAGILIIGALMDQELPAKTELFDRILVGVLVLAICASIQPNWKFYTKQNLDNTDRQRFDTLIEKYELPEGESYMLITSGRNGSYYIVHMARYLLNSNRVAFCDAADLEDTDMKNYHYVILFDETEESRAYFSQHYSADMTDVVCP